MKLVDLLIMKILFKHFSELESTESMNYRSLFLIFLAFFFCFSSARIGFSQNSLDTKKSDLIRRALEETIAANDIPGMTAAIVNEDGITAIASAGVRKVGSTEKMTNDDLVHIGSCTKAMTCTVLETLIAEDKLFWGIKLSSVFPEYKSKIHQDFHDVTLWELVTHRSGVPANAKSWWVYPKIELKSRRLAIFVENLKEPSEHKQGEYLYSNLGYMIASCMAEKATGKSWETLITERIFKPLEMKSASFGPPGPRGKIDQPWGHNKKEDQWQPRQFDNAEALGPAGRVHCKMEDWAKFITLQLPGNKPKILDRKHLDKLITSKHKYAAGWGVSERSWAKGKTLSHSGSNTMWYCIVWVAPNLNRAFIVATNSKDENSSKICDKLIGKLISIDKQK